MAPQPAAGVPPSPRPSNGAAVDGLCTLKASANSHTGSMAKSSFFPDSDPKAQVVVETQVQLQGEGAPPGHHEWPAATFHMVTQMIGAGVLALPKAFSILGWIFGPILLALFGTISFWSLHLLAEVYDRTEKRSRSYKDCVLQILGKNYYRVLVSIIYLKLFLNAVGYTVAGGTSIKYIAKISCQWNGETGSDICDSMQKNWVVMPIFLSLQLVMNGLPNMESIWWVSLIGAACSYLYSTFALALSWWKLAESGPATDTSLFGNSHLQPEMYLAAMKVFQALGNVLFAWTCATLAPSIQSTLKEPPQSGVSMKKALNVTFGSTAAFYFAVAISGYAAIGASAPGDIMTGFDKISPAATRLSFVGNIAVLLHMVSAVQLFSAPGYEFIEELMAEYTPYLLQNKPTEFVTRIIYRGIYLGLATACAASAPFFALFGGLVGSVAFFPIQVFFPYMMHTRTSAPVQWKKILMIISATFVACTCLLGITGSLYGIATTNEKS